MSFMCVGSSDVKIGPMYQHLGQLQNKSSFAFVDLDLSFEQHEALSKFAITESDDWQSCDMSMLAKNVEVFLRTIGTGEVDIIANIIHQIATQVMTALGKQGALVTLRSFMPTDEFDIPRWHIDWSFHKGSFLKFEATLIGNPTLFYPLTDIERSLFLRLDEEQAAVNAQLFTACDGAFLIDWDEKNHPFRLAKAHLLTTTPIAAGSGQGAFFIMGGKGAVFSEPEIHLPRLCVTVVAGTEKELKEAEKKGFF